MSTPLLEWSFLMEQCLKDAGEQYVWVHIWVWSPKPFVWLYTLSISLYLSHLSILLFPPSVSLSPSPPLSLSLSLSLFFPSSNDSWYGIGAFYTGNIDEGNTTENVSPSADIYYILSFNDIASGYGKWHLHVPAYPKNPVFPLHQVLRKSFLYRYCIILWNPLL